MKKFLCILISFMLTLSQQVLANQDFELTLIQPSPNPLVLIPGKSYPFVYKVKNISQRDQMFSFDFWKTNTQDLKLSSNFSNYYLTSGAAFMFTVNATVVSDNMPGNYVISGHFLSPHGDPIYFPDHYITTVKP